LVAIIAYITLVYSMDILQKMRHTYRMKKQNKIFPIIETNPVTKRMVWILKVDVLRFRCFRI